MAHIKKKKNQQVFSVKQRKITHISFNNLDEQKVRFS